MPILNWLNRDEHLKIADRVPYRILEEVPELSYGAPDAGNLLIQGDNLDTLKALLPFYAGQVKCIYIDPPYNTKSAFAHYDDNLEHSTWLGTMWARLRLLKDFLREDGSIWISIDDDECHYLKVVCDEVFGRQNFVANVVWQKRTSPDNRLRLGDAHDSVLVYSKNKREPTAVLNQLPVNVGRKSDFKNLDDDPRGLWASTDFTGMTGHATPSQFYTIVSPSGSLFPPPAGRCWAIAEDNFKKLLSEDRVWFGKNGKSRPRLKRFLSEMSGQNAWTWWTNSEVGHNQEAKKEINVLFGADNPFDTPKPERLIYRILTLATNPGDLVLDSFLGSGTTAAVAHKMGRRWIGIEMGEHARTHCAARLRKVIDGESGGISQAVNWSGGGGFRFFRLGGEVFETDGRIKAGITFDQLAAHIWFSETYTPWRPADGGRRSVSTFLGVHEETAYALLYNGVLGDRAPAGGNVLTSKTLQIVKHDIGEPPYKRLVIYGECALGSAWKQARIDFRQIPYDVKAR
jgi:adenine-specific DNA-methyltransferase